MKSHSNDTLRNRILNPECNMIPAYSKVVNKKRVKKLIISYMQSIIEKNIRAQVQKCISFSGRG